MYKIIQEIEYSTLDEALCLKIFLAEHSVFYNGRLYAC